MSHPAAAMMERPRTAALIVASGRGVRMGGPKALLRWTDGEALAVSHVHMRTDTTDVVVVARRPVAMRLRTWVPRARIIASAAPGPWGPSGSIAAAVRSGALASVSWALIMPVDLIPPKRSTVAALQARRGEGVDAVRPVFEGRGGHPVLVRTEVLYRLYTLPGEPPTLRDVLGSVASRCAVVSVDDPDIRADLDTPEAVRARTGRDPVFVAH